MVGRCGARRLVLLHCALLACALTQPAARPAAAAAAVRLEADAAPWAAAQLGASLEAVDAARPVSPEAAPLTAPCLEAADLNRFACAATVCGSAVRRILVLGDGDMSFAAALANQLDESIRLVATTFEDEGILRARYTNANAALDSLASRPSCAARHGIDATTLEGLGLLPADGSGGGDVEKFDRVIFMFPHALGKTNIGRNRNLLKGVFAAAASRGLAQKGEVLISLRHEQGGADAFMADECKLAWDSSWQCQVAAAEAHLALADLQTLDVDALEHGGYASRGHRPGLDRKFDARERGPPRVHVFIRECDLGPRRVARPIRFVHELQLAAQRGDGANLLGPRDLPLVLQAVQDALGGDSGDLLSVTFAEFYNFECVASSAPAALPTPTGVVTGTCRRTKFRTRRRGAR
ncbi:hypothetical protein M885DRAFT_511533 [Pelagophyceae sp. CCMP2097]|nr:hypothetical protein M885DRAFT_511533 [Pelagophyceae sp. CCMP2097]